MPYMQAKFQGRMSLQQAFAGPTEMGKAIGLVFNMEKIAKAPNTMLSHCLIALTPEAAREALIDDVYAAYFEHGQDIGDSEALLRIGARHGLDASKLRTELLGAAIRAQVEQEAEEARSLGIEGVPFFVVNGRYAFNGAQPPAVILDVLRQVAERDQAA